MASTGLLWAGVVSVLVLVLFSFGRGFGRHSGRHVGTLQGTVGDVLEEAAIQMLGRRTTLYGR
jgi:hypothetical protein